MNKAIVLALTITSATAGAVDVDRSNGDVVLSAAQRTAIATWVRSVWPDITLANVVWVACRRFRRTTEIGTSRVGALCHAFEERSLTAAEYESMEVAGRVRYRPSASNIAADGSGATSVEILHGPEFLTGGSLAALGSVANTVFDVPAASISAMRLWRTRTEDPETAVVTTTYYGRAAYRESLTATERLLCLRDGTCGEVAEPN